MRDADLESDELLQLSLQPGFVEGMARERRRFDSMAEAYRHLFRRNREYAVLLWNGVPVRLSYTDDIPALLEPLVGALEFLRRGKAGDAYSCTLESPSLSVDWEFLLSADSLTLRGHWRRVNGGYASTLNELDVVHMPVDDFLAEWKLLLEQLLKAPSEAAARFEGDAAAGLRRLAALEKAIANRGGFYQYGPGVQAPPESRAHGVLDPAGRRHR